nr:CpsB/CapC family capsule biosynthesis tyrosine phosphatase [Rhabdobacter roseus]
MTFSFLNRKTTIEKPPVLRFTSLRVDVHSHVLPGLDNGPLALESSVRMAQVLANAGIRKVIATPHIMKGYYENSVARIQEVCRELQSELRYRRIELQLEAAAEYYAEPELLDRVQGGEPLLTFGRKGHQPYLLFETGILDEPPQLEALIRSLLQRHIRPVLAHPERYRYLQKNFNRTIELFRMGVFFQLDWASFHARENPEVRQLAERLVDYRMVSFVGTNVHHESQLAYLWESERQPYFRLMTDIGLVNNELGT